MASDMPEPQTSKEVLQIARQGAPAAQMTLFPVTEVEVDGIGMGVLSDGTPYLTLRGLWASPGFQDKSLRVTP